MKKFNCMFSHCCGETRICCHFCNKKSCEWRCNDDCERCKYKETETEKKEVEIVSIIEKETKIKTHNEIVDTSVRDKLRKYKKDNKLHNDTLAKRVGVAENVIQRVVSKSASVKIRSDSYRKIKDYIKDIKSTEKRKLW